MAWYSYTVAMAVPGSEIIGEPNAMEIFRTHGDQEHLVFSASRNGALISLLKKLCDQSPDDLDLYLLRDVTFLSGPLLSEAANRIATLLSDLASNPKRVLEATKTRFEPS